MIYYKATRSWFVRLFILGLSLTIVSNCTSATSFYVATNGSKSGKGTIEDPWDLRTALAHPSNVEPGDSILVQGGTYHGDFLSVLTGTAKRPIKVIPVDGHVVIDGASGAPRNTVFTIKGAHTYYYNFEVTNSKPDRYSMQSGGRPTDVSNKTGLGILQNQNVKIINFIVHNHSGKGVGFWSTSVDSELYGTLIFNNGFRAKDRDHGPGLYLQNPASSDKSVRHCILSNNYTHGIQAFGTKGPVENIEISENVLFNNHGYNLLIGGRTRANNITVEGNVTYVTGAGSNVKLGLNERVKNGTITVKDNKFIGGLKVVNFTKWDQVIFQSNVVSCSPKEQLQWDGVAAEFLIDSTSALPGYRWADNQYYNMTGSRSFTVKPVKQKNKPEHFKLEQWRNRHQLDQNSSQYKEHPPSEIIVLPNEHDSHRANIVVLNFDLKDEIQLDLSSLDLPQEYIEIRNANDYFGPIPYSGIYSGDPINISMLSYQGPNNSKRPHAGPLEFTTFVVLVKNGY